MIAAPPPCPKRRPHRNPSVFAFGDGKLLRLTREQEATAPFDERLESVWQFVAKMVGAFCRGCSDRELAQAGVDDLLHECWIELRQKDDKWEPARGKYITFASTVVAHLLATARERNRTVHSPRNTAGRLRRLMDDPSPEAERKREVLCRRIQGGEAIDERLLDGLDDDRPARAALGSESARHGRESARHLLGRLSPREALALRKRLEAGAPR